MQTIPDFNEIVEHFCFKGDFLDAVPFGTGHINATYATRFKEPGGLIRRYILQRINTQIFKTPEQVMRNIERVTSYLRNKLDPEDADASRRVITLIPATDEHFFYVDPDGEYWRAEVFIEGAKTYLTASTLEHYFHASKAYGNFQKDLADFPIHELHITIPDFHNTGKRFQALIQAIEQDVVNRAVSAKPEINFALQRAKETTILLEMLANGEMHERVTHNDTKLDNVMLDDVTGDGVCVIDLDTVMPGLAVFDFGDIVRSGANTGLEDEPDLSKIDFDMNIFNRLAHGFLDATRTTLTPVEIDQLVFGAKLITFEQGLRFLTDHLNGDTYYKIHRLSHNLDRARTQFKLVQEMENHFDEMLGMIERYR
jgi:hypothetical protein